MHAQPHERGHDEQVQHGADPADQPEPGDPAEAQCGELSEEVEALAQRGLRLSGVAIGEVKRHLRHAKRLTGEDLQQDLEPGGPQPRGLHGGAAEAEEAGHGIAAVLQPPGEQALGQAGGGRGDEPADTAGEPVGAAALAAVA